MDWMKDFLHKNDEGKNRRHKLYCEKKLLAESLKGQY